MGFGLFFLLIEVIGFPHAPQKLHAAHGLARQGIAIRQDLPHHHQLPGIGEKAAFATPGESKRRFELVKSTHTYATYGLNQSSTHHYRTFSWLEQVRQRTRLTCVCNIDRLLDRCMRGT